ncbi:MAG: tetratricopeptide repeat protein [Planctomycetaceae bacterium]|nr:tetratricopeptide repeat protein [Planctomycetaceae bacterium]
MSSIPLGRNELQSGFQVMSPPRRTASDRLLCFRQISSACNVPNLCCAAGWLAWCLVFCFGPSLQGSENEQGPAVAVGEPAAETVDTTPSANPERTELSQQIHAAFQLLRSDGRRASAEARELLAAHPNLPDAAALKLNWIAGSGASLSHQHEVALEFLKNAELLARQLDDRRMLRQVLRYEAPSYFELSRYAEGSAAADEGIRISLELADDSVLLPSLYNEKAANDRKLGNYESALKACEAALKLAVDSDDFRREVVVRMNLAEILTDFGTPTDAMAQYELALKIVERDPNDFIKASIKSEMARTALELHASDRATGLLDEAEPLAASHEYTEIQARISEIRGDICLSSNNHPEAKRRYQAALEFWKQLENPAGIALMESRLAQLNLKQGSEESIVEQLAHIDALEQIGEIDQFCSAIDEILPVLTQRGEWQMIAELHARARLAEQQRWAAKNSESMARLRGTAESIESRRQINGLESENQKQQQQLTDHSRQLKHSVLALLGTAVILIIMAVLLKSHNRVISQLRESRDELQRRRQLQLSIERRLSERQRSESLAVMAAGIAHDFNNLLTVISGSAEVGGMTSDADQKDALFQQIQTTSIQASELTSQLLQFLGGHKPSVKATSLTDVVESVSGLLNSIVRRKGTLELAGGADGGLARIDETHARQILVNLVTNATDAIHDGGYVQLEIGQRSLWTDDLVAMPVHESAESGEFRYIRVSDNGAGISPDVVQRIFDPYFSTKSSGRGLGLASVMGIVRSCGGAIDVAAAELGGTRFTVYIPVVETQDAVEPQAKDDKPLETADSGRNDLVTLEWDSSVQPQPTVLFVDDESGVAESMCRLLNSGGLRTVQALNAIDALRLVERADQRFCCVVTDYSMPGESGLWLADQLKDRFPGLPVILCSGYTDQVHQLDGRVDSFLQKPYTGKQLLRQIQPFVSGPGLDSTLPPKVSV